MSPSSPPVGHFQLDFRRKCSALCIIVGFGLFFLQPAVAPIGAAIALAAILASPPLGLLAAFATQPLHLVTRTLGAVDLSAGEISLLAAALGGCMHWTWRQRRKSFQPVWPATQFDWPIAILLASGVISLLVTEYPRLSLRELRLLILEPIVAFYLLIIWFRGKAMLWPVGAFLTGAVGIAFAGLIGLLVGWGSSEAEGVRRLQAAYSSANHLGLLLGRALPWLLALIWLDHGWRRPAVIGALTVALAIGATFSFGAWLGVAAAALAVAWLAGRGRLLMKASVLSAVVTLAGALVFRPERVISHFELGQGTTFFRLQVWQSALAMVRDHPIFGLGLDNFLYLYQQRYILPGALAEPNLSHPHNFVLQFWLELGLLGLGAALWLIVNCLRLALRQWGSAPEPAMRALALGTLGCQVDLLVHGSFDNSYFLPDLALIFWLCLAAVEDASRTAATIARHSGETSANFRPD